MKRLTTNRILDIAFWLTMNVLIVVTVPIATSFLSRVAEDPQDYSSSVSDYSLIAFSIVFNIGVFIIEQSRESPEESLDSTAKGFAEKLVEAFAGKSVEELRTESSKRMEKELTKASIKRIEAKIKKRKSDKVTDSKLIILLCVITFACAALCLGVYGTFLSKNVPNLIPAIPAIVITTISLLVSSGLGITIYIRKTSREESSANKSRKKKK